MFERPEKAKTEQGVIFVELAISLPIVIALTFFVYWSFLALGWRDTVFTAVYEGVDLAAGRGNPVNLGVASTGDTSPEGLIPDLDRYANGEGWKASFGSANTIGLLASGNTGTDPQAVYNNFITKSGRWPGQTLNNFPRETFYAMAFAYQKLRAGLFSDTRYPCDPDDPENNGCLICVPASPGFFGLNNAATVPEDLFGIECRYRPSTAFLSVLTAFLNLDTSATVINHTRIYDARERDAFD